MTAWLVAVSLGVVGAIGAAAVVAHFVAILACRIEALALDVAHLIESRRRPPAGPRHRGRITVRED
ncbi:MAG: hypothetical protein ACLGIO_14215 [Acidimicrobiia bacterium]